ncbi:hypothetical protein ACFQ7M_18655 [Streptomyces massasporeus]
MASSLGSTRPAAMDFRRSWIADHRSGCGTILGKSAAGDRDARQPRPPEDAGRPAAPSAGRQQREVVQAFLAAARDGRFEELLRVLHPEVKLTARTPAGTFVTLGAAEVATRARGRQRGTRTTVAARASGSRRASERAPSAAVANGARSGR